MNVRWFAIFQSSSAKFRFHATCFFSFPHGAGWRDRKRGRSTRTSAIVTAFYPARVFAVQAIRVEHTLPLWSPYILNDVPFLAQSAILAVLSADCLYYVLPVSLAWTLCLMLQILLSAVFILVFERESDRLAHEAVIVRQ